MQDPATLQQNTSITLIIPKSYPSKAHVDSDSWHYQGLTYHTVTLTDQIEHKIKKCLEQAFTQLQEQNSQPYSDSIIFDQIAEFYEQLFASKNLPDAIAQLEPTSRYYHHLWRAWHHYSHQELGLMTQCLLASLEYTDLDAQNLVSYWSKFLEPDSHRDISLATLPEWQQLFQKVRKITPPKISVIIPSYNSAQYLPQALESVFQQTYKNFEIIVINDGSTDQTIEVIRPYLDRIRYFHQANRGVSAARNRGLYLARGELIAFLDADDLFLPHKLAEQAAVFAARPEIGIVNSGFRVIRENGEPIIDVERWQEIPDLTPEVWLLYKPVLPSAMMFRRHWFTIAGGFDPKFCSSEDVELTLRMVLKGCQGTWLEQVTINYRRHEQSVTWQHTLRQAENAEQMQDDFFARTDLPENMRALEAQSRFYYFSWLAWLCYQGNLASKMTEYLLKSHYWGSMSWVEMIERWLDTFSGCAAVYGCDFNVSSLTKLPQWLHVISQIQISPLVDNYQQIISQEQKLFHPFSNPSQLPLYSQTYFQLGQKLIQQHDLERAILCLRQAIELEPRNAFYHHALGQAHQAKYELNPALMAYQRAMGLQPEYLQFQESWESTKKLLLQWHRLLDYCQLQSQPVASLPTTATRKRILMIFPFTPDPEQKGGAAIRMLEQIKYFGRHYQLTIVAFVYGKFQEQLQTQLEQYCDFALLLEVGAPMSPYHQQQHQQLYFLQTWNMWKSLEQLSRIDFDAVFFEFIFSTVYYPLFCDRLTILNEHNIESKLLLSSAQTDNSELIRHLAQKVDAVKPFLAAKTKAKFLAAYEEKMWPYFSLITTVSELDQQEIKTRITNDLASTKTLVVKNGVNTREIQPVDNSKAQKILFMGTMSYLPNIDGILYFVQQIFPLIRQHQPELKLCIAGREPPEEIISLSHNDPNIEVIANPSDMKEIAAECQMSIVPLRIGGGTRIKILHSLALGLPVVSTSLGCEGLKLTDGDHLLIRDNPEDFAAGVLNLASDDLLRTKLRFNGRQLVETQYDWQAIFSRFDQVLANSMASPVEFKPQQ